MVASAAERIAELADLPSADIVKLLSIAHELSGVSALSEVMDVVRVRARQLMQADGVTFVVREGEQVFYADEDAIGPLWKGRRFPASACISGWAMLNQQSVAIPDIYRDDRIPVTAYRPTFVKSLLMVPIRPEDPLGAIGAYWADHHAADARERRLLETVAGFAALAVANAQLHQEARDAVRARDEWLGIASHELRTPLTPLKLQIESLTRALARGVPTVELGRRLRGAERSVGRLARLVEQLLDYRRFSGGTIALQPHDVELAALAREVCERFTDGDDPAASSPIEVIAPREVWCRCDRARVDHILTNLVSNAQKYGQGEPITVEVEARDDRGGVRISVSDRGPGIRPEDQERIFQPFARLADRVQGVGLGLWIVRSLVQAHGGSTEVLSRPGAGTRLVVILPSASPLAAA